MRFFLLGAVVALFVPLAARLSAKEARFYPIEPISFTKVEITDHFWKQHLDTSHQKTIPHVLKQCEQTGRLRNFRIAAGLEHGEFEGAFFNDSDVYKILEGMAYSLDAPLAESHRQFLDDFIAVLSKAQMEDGYLYTFYQVKKEMHRQWNEISMHEVYCAGHLIEAGVAHYEATGNRKLLDLVIRFADLIDKTYGPDKRLTPPGHQEIELALVKLYHATGKERYLELAKFFLEQRGNLNRGHVGNWYEQDHKPLLEQEEAVGHAVRAVYGYAGMADIAALTDDERYQQAIDRLWQNVVGKKMAISGGIGGGLWEAFDKEYFLPNPSSYNETCGSIAMVLWNHRMFLLHGDAKYIDVMERALYNGTMTGVSSEGDAFFYPNPLESGGGVRQPWFGCACCPSNIARIIPSVPGYLYARRDDRLYVNLFASSRVKTPIAAHEVTLTQETNYPWDGNVRFTVAPDSEARFTLMLRIPGWTRNAPVPTNLYHYLNHSDEVATLQVNGESVPVDLNKGYVEIQRTWLPGDVVELKMPMPVRRVVAHPEVKDDRGLVALERGPLVYCVEGVDNAGVGHRMQNMRIQDGAQFAAEYREDLFGGMVVLSGNVQHVSRASDGVGVVETPHSMTAVPYFARANRGSTPMAVWLLRDPSRAVLDPVHTLAIRSKVTSSTEGGNFAALRDQIEPARSADASRGVFNWNGRVGTTEWVQYEFPEPTIIAASDVYWYDRFGTIERRPESWRLLYRKEGQWLPVKNTAPYAVELDTYNRVTFEPVTTDALRLEATLQSAFLDPYLALPSTKPSAFSASILEWRVVEAAGANAAADERSKSTEMRDPKPTAVDFTFFTCSDTLYEETAEQNGGMDPLAWQPAVELEACEAGLFHAAIEDLAPATAYYCTFAQNPADIARADDRSFTHPGVLHSRAELDYIRKKVAGGQEPWKTAWEQLQIETISKLDWQPKPAANVVRGPYNKPDIGGTPLMCDGAAAYTHALQWYITGEKAHADKAAEILNAYTDTLQTVGGHDARLLVGMAGINFVNAAEILRHTEAGWEKEDQKGFEHLLRDVFYPVIKDFYPSANGNWDASMIQTMMAMGVFLDDRAIFQRAVDYYLEGKGNGAIANYINEFGECQESGRDQAHTQMGLGYLGCAAEIAWKQGIDLYSAYESRLALGYEYTAKYNLGHDVPYLPYQSYRARYHYPKISDKARGRFSNIYERVYHHYHDRKERDMPFTKQVITKIRPESWQKAHVPWGTLMHSELPVFPQL